MANVVEQISSTERQGAAFKPRGHQELYYRLNQKRKADKRTPGHSLKKEREKSLGKEGRGTVGPQALSASTDAHRRESENTASVSQR